MIWNAEEFLECLLSTEDSNGFKTALDFLECLLSSEDSNGLECVRPIRCS